MTTRRMHRSPRFGFTLYELVLVIAVVGLIGTVSVRLFHALVRQQTATTKQLVSTTNLARLQQRFAADVNAAVDAEIATIMALLTLPRDVVVRWEQTGNAMVRTIETDQGVRNDHFDLLPEQSVVFLRNSSAPGHDILEIAISVHREAADDNRYVVAGHGARIAAELSRDHRWNRANEVEE